MERLTRIKVFILQGVYFVKSFFKKGQGRTALGRSVMEMSVHQTRQLSVKNILYIIILYIITLGYMQPPPQKCSVQYILNMKVKQDADFFFYILNSF